MCLCWPNVIDMRWAREHLNCAMDLWKSCLVRWITICVSSRRWPCQRMPSFRRMVASFMYSRSFSVRWGRYDSLGASLGPIFTLEQTLNAAKYLNAVIDNLHPYIESIFETRCVMFQQDNAPCHKFRIVLEWFQEYDTEFQFISWPPKSPDFFLKFLKCQKREFK